MVGHSDHLKHRKPSSLAIFEGHSCSARSFSRRWSGGFRSRKPLESSTRMPVHHLVRFGVFQEYYLSTPPFNTSSEQTINAIGNIAVGFQYLELPIVIAIAQRRPQWVRTMSWCSLAACTAGLFLSSFATAVSNAAFACTNIQTSDAEIGVATCGTARRLCGY